MRHAACGRHGVEIVGGDGTHIWITNLYAEWLALPAEQRDTALQRAAVGIGIDSTESIRLVSTRDLDKWNVPFEALEQIAIPNRDLLLLAGARKRLKWAMLLVAVGDDDLAHQGIVVPGCPAVTSDQDAY
jgi:hypothetical protein